MVTLTGLQELLHMLKEGRLDGFVDDCLAEPGSLIGQGTSVQTQTRPFLLCRIA